MRQCQPQIETVSVAVKVTAAVRSGSTAVTVPPRSRRLHLQCFGFMGKRLEFGLKPGLRDQGRHYGAHDHGVIRIVY
jgi:hypothetical protein